MFERLMIDDLVHWARDYKVITPHGTRTTTHDLTAGRSTSSQPPPLHHSLDQLRETGSASHVRHHSNSGQSGAMWLLRG
jgi:hypothetical protein